MAKKRKALKSWPVCLDVYFPGDNPRYPGRAYKVSAHIAASSAVEAVETVLAVARAHWPQEWKVEDYETIRPGPCRFERCTREDGHLGAHIV